MFDQMPATMSEDGLQPYERSRESIGTALGEIYGSTSEEEEEEIVEAEE